MNKNPIKKSKKKKVIKEKPSKLVHITRSFTYKLNTGNYESRDFFASQTAECYEKDIEKVSEAIYQFVKAEVLKSVNEWRKGDIAKAGDQGRESAELDLD